MRVMTFNLRFENDLDAGNGWSFRRDSVVATILREAPDILGTEEGRPGMLDHLREHLPGYAMHASPERVRDAFCQYPTLFIRESSLAILAGGEFWLSPTPDVHCSKGWDSAFPRMMSHARLRGRETGREMVCAVTHLDHLGPAARLEQGRMVAAWAEAVKGPCVVMGDFNDRPGSPAHRALTGAGLADCWEALGLPEGPGAATHHDFRGNATGGSRIDWILASAHFRVVAARVVREPALGRFPSDHFPVAVDLAQVA